MGGAISISQFNTLQSTDDKQSRSVKSIDRFVQVALTQVRKEDAMRAIVSNSLAFSTFCCFLSQKIMKKNITDDLITGDIVESASNLNLIVTNALRILLSGNESFANTHSEKYSKYHKFACDSILMYLHNPYYVEWRVMEGLKVEQFLSEERHTAETTLPELQTAIISSKERRYTEAKASFSAITSPDCSHTVEVFSENSAERIRADKPKPILAVHLSDEIHMGNNSFLLNRENSDNSLSSAIKLAIASCDPLEVTGLIKSDKWLLSLISDAETLPVGITLSAICKDRTGYPLVYANNYFAKKSGYLRQDIIGQSFGFMHPRGTIISPDGEESVLKVAYSLAECETAVIGFNSLKPNGKPFISVVGVKPVLNQHHDYCYVVGIHMNVSVNVTAKKGISLVTALIDTLPGVSKL